MTLTEIMDKHGRDSAKITRDTAVKMVNSVIVFAEQGGLESVPIALLRDLADAINSLPTGPKK